MTTGETRYNKLLEDYVQVKQELEDARRRITTLEDKVDSAEKAYEYWRECYHWLYSHVGSYALHNTIHPKRYYKWLVRSRNQKRTIDWLLQTVRSLARELKNERERHVLIQKVQKAKKDYKRTFKSSEKPKGDNTTPNSSPSVSADLTEF